MRRLRVEHERPEALWQDLRPAGVHEERRRPRSVGSGRAPVLSSSGSGARGRSSRAAPSSASRLRSGSRSAEGRSRRLHARPAGGVCERRRAEGGEITEQHVVERFRLGDRWRAEHTLRGGEDVGAAALPRARRRHSQQVEVDAVPGDGAADERDELVAPARRRPVPYGRPWSRGERSRPPSTRAWPRSRCSRRSRLIASAKGQ